jgi:hypothetical protein
VRVEGQTQPDENPSRSPISAGDAFRPVLNLAVVLG